MTKIQSILKTLQAHKFVAAFAVVLASVVLSTTVTANAAPDYFAVAKPSARSQCEGGTWKTTYTWQYQHHWWHHVSTRVWKPNWQKLGFSSHQQCVTYVSTPQPTSKRQCDRQRHSLGFASKNDCERYLRIHPGSGYGGDDDDTNGYHNHGRN